MTDMFSKSEAYENLMGRWSDRLAPVFMEFAGVRDGERVLDVGCGTGALCRAVLDATRRSEVVGVDPSEPFIAYARAQCAVRSGEHTPFPPPPLVRSGGRRPGGARGGVFGSPPPLRGRRRRSVGALHRVRPGAMRR